jgi:hypothetical protein
MISMSRFTLGAVKFSAIVFLTATLGSCGGGTSEELPQVVLRPANAAPLQSTSGVTAMTLTVSLAESLMQLAHQSKVWHEALIATKVASSTTACGDKGERKTQWLDSNGNSTVDAGDTVSAALKNCLVDSTGVQFTGEFSWLVGSSSSERATLQVVLRNLTYTQGTTALTWNGGLLVQSSVSAAGDSIRVTPLDGVPLTTSVAFTVSDSTAGASTRFVAEEFFPSFDLEKERVLASKGSISKLAMTLHSGVMGGAVVLETLEPLFATANTYPVKGILRLKGESGPTGVVYYLRHGRGLESAREALSDTGPRWDSMMLGFFWWFDGSLPGAYRSIKNADRSIPFQMLTTLPHKVRSGRGEIVLKFNREFEKYCGSLELTPVRALPTMEILAPSVVASIETDGSSIILRPRDPLALGVSYTTNLFTGPGFCPGDDAGSPLFQYLLTTLGDSVAGQAVTLDAVDEPLLIVDASRMKTVVPGWPIAIDARPGPGAQGALSYQWRTVVESSVVVSDQNTQRVQVSVPFQAGVRSYQSEVEVTGTAANGSVDRVRSSVNVVPDPALTTVIHIQSTVGDGVFEGYTGVAEGLQSSGAFVQAVSKQQIVVSVVVEALELKMNVSLSSDRLVLGIYDVKAPDPSQSSADSRSGYVFSAGRGCVNPVGQIEIIEAPLALQTSPAPAFGVPLSTLALDFVFSCDGRPGFRGSYRHRSSAPLKPI